MEPFSFLHRKAGTVRSRPSLLCTFSKDSLQEEALLRKGHGRILGRMRTAGGMYRIGWGIRRRKTVATGIEGPGGFTARKVAGTLLLSAYEVGGLIE